MIRISDKLVAGAVDNILAGADNIYDETIAKFQDKINEDIYETLSNIYRKSETYSQTEVDQLIATVKQFRYVIVETLPEASSETMNKIYLVKQSEEGKTGDYYNEYITLLEDGVYKWESLGDTRIDLSGKVDKEEGKHLVEDTKVAAYDAHIINTSNPHSVTKDQVGLGNCDNTADSDKPISTATQTALDNKVDKVSGSSLVPDSKVTAYDSHLTNQSNPHNVTKDQVGLGSVNNTADMDKPVSTATLSALREKVDKVEGSSLVPDTKVASYDAHLTNTENPHSVTKSQLGLGNVDNTSDANKPISTATQEALDLKVDKVEGKDIVSPTEHNTAYTHATTTHNAAFVGLGNVTNDAQVKRTEMGVAGGVATLGEDGKIHDAQLPSSVSDILEYPSRDQFPETGEAKKIYVAKDTNRIYRWDTSTYTEVAKTLELGETETTAYRGDRGKVAYDHTSSTSNPHNVTATQVGLGNVDNTSDLNKPISTATQDALDEKVDKVEGKGIVTLTEHDAAYSHISRTDNPHSVTKDQVGLGNCDNTSDANKPISNATQTALNTKLTYEDISSVGDEVRTVRIKESVSGETLYPETKGSVVFLGSGSTSLDTRIADLGENEDLETTEKGTLVGAINEVAQEITTHTSSTSNPHSVTKDQVGLGNVTNDAQVKRTEMGVASGVAVLGSDGKVLSTQLPSYVDDVLEFSTLDAFPIPGESGKIYVALDTNKTYRWSGSIYVEISASLALGETETTAYRGDRGKIAYDHTSRNDNPHSVNKSQVGLGNCDNTSDADKPISDATQTALDGKVDKVTGKDIVNPTEHDDAYAHISRTDNPHSVTKAQIGLGKVENYSAAEMPISGATQSALDLKVDKITGKGLSTNDYTTAEKTKLGDIEDGAEVNVQSDWAQTDTAADDYIKNKPSYTDTAESGKFVTKVDTVSGIATPTREALVASDIPEIPTSKVTGLDTTVGEILAELAGKASISDLIEGTLIPALARNLYSPTDLTQTGQSFLLRTSGGQASIRTGSAVLSKVYGASAVPEKTLDTFTKTYTPITSGTTVEWTVSEGVCKEKLFGSSPTAGTTYSMTATYNGSAWIDTLSATVSLAEYGITITSTPVSGDVLTVSAIRGNFGTITFTTPASLVAYGLNSFQPSNILNGYTIDASGNITAAEGKCVCLIEAAWNSSSNFTGYTVYNTFETTERVGWSSTKPGTSTTGLTLSSSADSITFSASGWISVAISDGVYSGLCVHPKWSGYLDKTYSDFTSSAVTIPVQDSGGNTINFWAVGSYRNYIDLVGKTYSRLITRTAYTPAALESFISGHSGWTLGTDYDYDEAWIYYRQTAVVSSLASTVSGGYQVYDFSVEKWTGTSISPVADFLYGQNLVDKLRVDVVTKDMLGDTINHGTNDTSGYTLTNNDTHIWDVVGSLDISSLEEHDGVYLVIFKSGSTATTLTLPTGIYWNLYPVTAIQTNRTYHLGIMHGYGYFSEFNEL